MRELTITELKPLFEEFGLGPNFQGLTLIREIARLRAKLATQSAVLEAATAWADASYPITDNYREYRAASDTLLTAVATLRAQEQK